MPPRLAGMALLALTLTPARTQQAHDLPLTPANIHWGYYDARIKPVLTIRSGDSVRVQTMVARGVERLRLAGVRDSEIPASLTAVEQAVTERGPGAHPLTGPIFVAGS